MLRGILDGHELCVQFLLFVNNYVKHTKIKRKMNVIKYLGHSKYPESFESDEALQNFLQVKRIEIGS